VTVTEEAVVNGHEADTPVTEIIPAHEQRIGLADIPNLYAQPDRRLISLLPKTSCGDCSKGRCQKHTKAKCKTCGAWISTAHIHLDFVGHAEVTLILTRVDPMWSWEPRAWDEDGGPRYRRSGNLLELWGTLTVLGKTLPCVGTCEASKAEAAKELIGDLLRNGAMRFGIGTGLWSKVEAADREHAYEQEDAKLAPAAEPSSEPKPARSKNQRQTVRARRVAEEAVDAGAGGQLEDEAAALAAARHRDDDPPVENVPTDEEPQASEGDWFAAAGWLDKQHHDETRKQVLAAAKRLPDERRDQVKAELASFDIDPGKALTVNQAAWFRYLVVDAEAQEEGAEPGSLRAVVLAATNGAHGRLMPDAGPAVCDDVSRLITRWVGDELDEAWGDTGGLALTDRATGQVVAEYTPAQDEEPF
jgi:hypothetical protein